MVIKHAASVGMHVDRTA